MTPETQARLLALNQQFYEDCGEAFSETRLRLQPGVLRCLAKVPPAASVLDAGCGNGNALAELFRRGHTGVCVGVDASQALLQAARKLMPTGAQALFLPADLAQPGWDELLPLPAFDFIFAFAVFHHLPGSGLRKQLIERIRGRLAPGGKFIHSHWQFQYSARLMSRVQPWDRIGLSPADLEEGDTLLDWRRGATGLRYVHLSSAETLCNLADETGFQVLESFSSDGEGGNLGLYQIWEYNQA